MSVINQMRGANENIYNQIRATQTQIYSVKISKRKRKQ